jgi:hypothetical protein
LRISAAEQVRPEWQATIEALIMAAEDRGPLMHAHDLARRKADSGMRFGEDEALGTSEVEEGQLGVNPQIQSGRRTSALVRIPDSLATSAA